MKQSGFGIASMVIGIICLLLSCLRFGYLGILGIIFAGIALAQKEKGHGTAIAGLVTSIIALLISLLVSQVTPYIEESRDKKESSEITRESREEDKKEEKKDDGSKATIYKDDDYTYEVKSYDIKKINGVSCILIYVNFTNNSSNSASANDNMVLKVFQDGVELEKTYNWDYSKETKNYDKAIKKGKTIQVCEIFQLSNKKSDVELEIDNAFLIESNKVTGTIKLKGTNTKKK